MRPLSRVLLAIFTLSSLVTLACATDLNSLAPFPCALDGTCPEGFDCTSASQCVAAAICTYPQFDCLGVCVSSDDQNCGTCGKACGGHESCCNGSCCEGTCCGGTSCDDLETDVNNCGTCGHSCPGGAKCAAEKCECPQGASGTPEVACTSPGGGLSCTDTTSDDSNCGSCGNACSSVMTNSTCTSSACVCSGATPDTCPGACVDFSSDNGNCGKCSNPCTSPETCSSGSCQCLPPNQECSGVCVDTTSDSNNCGYCSHMCVDGMTCQSRNCACPSGSMQCIPGGPCIDTQTDPSNCGGCSMMSPTGMCAGGCPVPTAGSTCSPVLFLPAAPLCGCGSGENCDYNATGTGVWGCLAASTGGLGASCQSGTTGNQALCAPGYQCVALYGTTSYSCYPACCVGSSACPACPYGYSCQAIDDITTPTGGSACLPP